MHVKEVGREAAGVALTLTATSLRREQLHCFPPICQ